jgi:hypothetical protein
MNISELYSIFSATYNQLYNSFSEATDTIESIFAGMFDDSMKTDPDFKQTMKELVEYREDFISSDREAAAAAIAYITMKRREAFKKLTQTA